MYQTKKWYSSLGLSKLQVSVEKRYCSRALHLHWLYINIQGFLGMMSLETLIWNGAAVYLECGIFADKTRQPPSVDKQPFRTALW